MDQGRQINNLIEVAEIVRASGRRELATWFESGLDKFLSEDTTLEEAMDLNGGKGKRKARTIWQQKLRDDALRSAYQHISGKNTTGRIRELRTRARRFEGLVYGRHCHLNKPPEGWSQLRQHLFRALKSGCPMPDSERQFYRIVMGW